MSKNKALPVCHECRKTKTDMHEIREYNDTAGRILPVCGPCLSDINASMQHERVIVEEAKQKELFDAAQ